MENICKFQPFKMKQLPKYWLLKSKFLSLSTKKKPNRWETLSFWMSVDDRYAAHQQGLQHTLPLPAGGVEDHPSKQPEKPQAGAWRATLPAHGGHVSLIQVITRMQTTRSSRSNTLHFWPWPMASKNETK